MPLRRPTVAFLLKPFMWCRLDARLWYDYYLFVHLSRRRSRHPIGFHLFCWVFRRTTADSLLLTLLAKFSLCIGKLIMTRSCMHLLYLTSELSCEYFQSTHLACWFGQMLTKAIAWMKNSIASPTPRGVPVSLVRSLIWSLYYIRFRYPNKFIEPHSDARWAARLRVLLPTPLWHIHHHFYFESVVCHHTLVSYPPLCTILACL